VEGACRSRAAIDRAARAARAWSVAGGVVRAPAARRADPWRCAGAVRVAWAGADAAGGGEMGGTDGLTV